MLFAVDAAGVPSVSAIVELARTVAPSPPPVNLALNRPATGSTRVRVDRGAREGGQRLRLGRLAPTSSARTASDRYLRVDLGSNRTISTLRRQARRSRGRVHGHEHARLPVRDADGERDLQPRRRPSPATPRASPRRRSRRARRATCACAVTAGEQANAAGPAPDLRARGLQRRDRAAPPRRRSSPTRGSTRPAGRSASRSARTRRPAATSGWSARTPCGRWTSRRATGRRCAETPACSAARRWAPAATRRCRRASTARSARCGCCTPSRPAPAAEPSFRVGRDQERGRTVGT